MDDVILLKRRLAETEARLTARLLLSAQQSLPTEQYELLWKQFEDNASIDLLEMERDISSRALTLSENLSDLHEAVRDFRAAQMRMNDFEQRYWDFDGERQNPQELANALIAAREKMFSLLDEYELKERVGNQNLIE